MIAGRGLWVAISLLVICLAVGDFTLAREPEAEPEAEESAESTEEPQAEAEEPEEEPAAEEPEAETKPDGSTEQTEEKQEVQQEPQSETVTVTATRVETDLMKTPVAVTVIDQDTLNRQGVHDIVGMAQLVPNMDISTLNGQSTPIISLRGVRSTNETELGDPAVGVYLDGIYTPRMQGALGLMFDNERVEVLRGPQGTLFGRNSTVGNINIITAKPKFDGIDSNVLFQYGNYNWTDLQGYLNVPISDTFAMRFSGRYFQRDSYIDGYWDPNQYDQRYIQDIVQDAPAIAPASFADCTSPECLTRTQHSNWWFEELDGDNEILALVPAGEDFYMNAQEWAYRLSGLWERSDKRMSLNFMFQHFRSDSAGGIDLVNCEKLRGRPVYDIDDEGNNLGIIGTNDCSDLFPADDTYQAVVNVPGRLFLDIKYLRTQFTWDIKDNLRFIYLAGGEVQDRESAQDMEQSLNAWDGAMFFLPGTGSQSWMNEIQFQSYGNRKLNWIAGLNYFQEKTSTFGFYDNPIDEKALWDQPDRSTNAWSLFTQGTYSFTDRWHLTLGLRYSAETKEDKGGRTYLCNNQNGCAPGMFNRDELNSLPDDYFEDLSIYPEFSANDNKGSWSSTDWRIGMDYELGDTLIYSYLATGFKSGGIGDVFSETNPRTQEQIDVRTAYDPEKVITLELGLKQRLLNNRLNLSAAYFYSDYRDMQYASVGAIAFTERWERLRDQNGQLIVDDFGNFVFGWVDAPIIAYFTQNVPGARIQGIELEYDSRPWGGGRIHGYASWLDTEVSEDWITKWNYDPVSYFGINFEDSIDPTNELLETNLKGNELAVSPPFKFRMTVEHAFLNAKQNSGIVPWITFYWEGASYLTIWNVDKHTDDMDFVILDEDIQYTDDRREAWSMLHAGVRWYFSDWTMEVYGYNLTNTVVQYWGGAAEQVPKGSFSMPRTYGIRLGYTF